MDSDHTVFDDLMVALHEVEEHQKGNISLRSHVVTIPDDEIKFYDVYKKLSEPNKQKAMRYVNELLRASG